MAAVLLLSHEWEGIVEALSKADPVLLLCAFTVALCNVAFTGFSWRALLMRAPVELSAKASARIFFVGQIGKYLPGTIWSFLASGSLAKQAGLARGAAMSSLALALLIGVGAGVLVAIVTLPQTLGLLPQDIRIWLIGLVAALLILHPRIRAFALKLARIDFPVPVTALCLSVATALLAWAVAGAHILLLSQAIGVSVGWDQLPEMTGAYAFAWIAGFLVLIAPAGLGAREGGLLMILSLSMGFAEATAIILLSRLVVTAADFTCAGLALLLANPPTSPTTPPHQPPG